MAVHRTFDGDVVVVGAIKPEGGIEGYVPEAPNTADAFVRKGLAWVVLSWALLPDPPIDDDAPSDTKIYARQDGAWVEIFNLSPFDVESIAQEVMDAWAEGRSVTGGISLAGGGELDEDQVLTLLNDEPAPGNSQYYGTDSGGTKGWHALPSGGGGGGGTTAITKKTAAYTATSSDQTIICEFSSDEDLTLPVTGMPDGKLFTVVRVGGSGLVVVKDGTGSTLRSMNTAHASSTWVWCATDSAYYQIAYIAGT